LDQGLTDSSRKTRDPTLVAEGFPRRQDDFHALPFQRFEGCGVKTPERSWTGYPKERLAILLALDRLIQVGVDAINLSFGYYDEPFSNVDPLQIATRVAANRGIPVIVAAGNRGPRADSLQVLARAPWVITVGALDDKERLLRSSSRGPKDGSGPTIVAGGATLLRRTNRLGRRLDKWIPVQPGSSFATSRITIVAAITKRCLEIIFSNLTAQQDGTWTRFTKPFRLVTVGIADSGLDSSVITSNEIGQTMWNEGAIKQVARTDRECEWYRLLTEWLDREGIVITAKLDVFSVKRTLQEMARSLPRYQSYEVGAGVVEQSEMVRFFRVFLPSAWISIFCPDAMGAMDPTLLASLDEELGPIWEADYADLLVMTLTAAARIWFVRILGTDEELKQL
jgi:hypothetical protein